MKHDSQPILELTLPAGGSIQGAWTIRHFMAAILAAIIGTLVIVAVLPSSAEAIDRAMQALGLGNQKGNEEPDDLRAEADAVANMNVDDKTQLVAEGESAQERNAAIPLSTSAVESAKGFALESLSRAEMPTALKCLTQAVYYEAAFEPITGRRAVAQVVLNRMRHPAYPKSVCGVVYQGSYRRTGCQFSFTCDGSLLRAPAPAAWREAAAVARAALSGFVEPSVGTATHYHADYVLPKWAFNLSKIEQIGRHIFYRFHGGMGRVSAFGGSYAGNEHIPAPNFLMWRERLAEQELELSPGDVTPGLTVTPHVTDRHAANDVGGRIDMTKTWRLNIPVPDAASSRYRSAVENIPQKTNEIAIADAPDSGISGRTVATVKP